MKFLSFFIFGVLNYGVNIGLTFFFVKTLGISKPFAYSISLGIVCVLSFLSSLFITFGKKFHFFLFLKYVVTLLSFTALNYFLVLVIDRVFNGQWYFFVIFGVTTGVFLLKYSIYNRFVFK